MVVVVVVIDEVDCRDCWFAIKREILSEKDGEVVR